MCFVVAIGVDFAEKRAEPSAGTAISPPSLRDTLVDCGRHEDLTEVSPTEGCIEVKAYDQVDDFIRRLTKDCMEHNRNKRAEEHICYFIAVCWKGSGENGGAPLRAQKLLTNMLSDNRALWDQPVAVVMTAKAYAKVHPHFQDTYRPSTEVQGFKVHQRFREGVATCFVISPIGVEGSPTRRRADEVFETYIKPACSGTDYRAVRGEMMSGDRISSATEAALRTSPMVIAYLGSPKLGWNPNVMYEIGHRNALDLPVVVLKDATVDGKPYELPFDIKDQRCVELPETTPTEFENLAPKIRTIRQYVEERKPTETTIYPSATVETVIPLRDDEPATYIEASPSLDALFELPDIKGRTLSEVIEHLAKKMSSDQCQAFLKDQERILGNLILNKTQPADISAHIPILFEGHATLRGRAFLPIIVSHLFIKPTSSLRLNVVYIEVTSATRRNRRKKCVECRLIGGGALNLQSG